MTEKPEVADPDGNDPTTCPVCGADHPDMSFLNVTAIKSATTWVRIELTDDQISKLFTGMWRIELVPVEARS